MKTKIVRYNVYDLVSPLRNRTPMYTGGESLKSLRAYILGILYSLEHIENAEITGFLIGRDFNQWVASKYSVSTVTAGWANIITAMALDISVAEINEAGFDWEAFDRKATCKNHYRSINLFFELFDEFHELWLESDDKLVVRSRGDHSRLPVIKYKLPE